MERVKTELKGTDPMDTAARQMGAFWQLQQIIKDLSGTRVNRNELSPRENELIGAYRGGYQNAEQSYASPPDKAKWYQMHTSDPPASSRTITSSRRRRPRAS